MNRILVPVGLAAFLLVFALGRGARFDVPSRFDLTPVPAALLGARFSVQGPITGIVGLTRSRVLAGATRELHLVANLTGNTYEAGDVRPPLALVLAMDRSGSMRAEGKFEAAIAAAEALVRRLRPDDVFGIVTYSTDAETVLPARRVGDGREALAALATIEPGGSTNISEGLERALAELASHVGGSRLARLILLSDGKANHGLTERGPLAGLARGIRAKGVSISALGLGLTYDEEIMQDIAREGGGAYAFLDRADAVGKVLERELGNLTRLAARDVVLRLRPAAGIRTLAFDGYPCTQAPDGSLEIALGHFAAGEVRKAIVRLEVQGPVTGTETELVRVELAGSARARETFVPWFTQGRLGVGGASTREDEERSKDDVLLARLEEDKAARVLETAVQELRRGDVEAAGKRLEAYGAEARRQARDLYRDPALEARMAGLETLAREIPRVADEEARENWVKKSRENAFQLSR